MSVIFTRRSVRTYTDRPVENDKLLRIAKAGFEAPSAHWRRPWEFMIITDVDKIEAISKMDTDPKWGGSWCGRAKAIIAVLLNKEKKMPPELDPDDGFWIQDLSAATQNILLHTVEEGLGACWLGWYPSKTRVDNFTQYFKLPDNILPFSLIALGYPEKEPRIQSHYKAEKVYLNEYGVNFNAN
jgi:nitroreductase